MGLGRITRDGVASDEGAWFAFGNLTAGLRNLSRKAACVRCQSEVDDHDCLRRRCYLWRHSCRFSFPAMGTSALNYFLRSVRDSFDPSMDFRSLDGTSYRGRFSNAVYG